jgi:class 3 adenylate cyclase
VEAEIGFSAFLDIIYTNGGDVNETAGDGLMAIFQGDEREHALNAATAALQIRKKTNDTNHELQGIFPPVVVNIGINLGKAFVGMSKFIGDSHTRMTFTASGSVTNLAARLSSACREGEILVGSETARRIKDTMVLWERGLMRFKNFREPIHVFSLVPPA